LSLLHFLIFILAGGCDRYGHSASGASSKLIAESSKGSADDSDQLDSNLSADYADFTDYKGKRGQTLNSE